MRAAVFDLGSNTFNLLIFESSGKGKYRILHRSELPVKIGKGSYVSRTIQPEAMDRGLTVLKEHFKAIKKWNPDIIKATGTAALRNAENAGEFLSQVKSTFGIDVELIDGNRESELIYKGVRLSYPFDIGNFIIVDIGGGSCEFIIAGHQHIHFQKSYDIGVSRILEQIAPHDPVSSDEVIAIEKLIDHELHDLFDISTRHLVHTMIGASGSFETFTSMLFPEYEQLRKMEHCHELDLSSLYQLYLGLLKSKEKDRMNMRGLPAMRVDTIVIASVLVNYIIHKLRIRNLLQSDFALKEGIMAELIKEQ